MYRLPCQFICSFPSRIVVPNSCWRRFDVVADRCSRIVCVSPKETQEAERQSREVEMKAGGRNHLSVGLIMAVTTQRDGGVDSGDG